MPHVPGLRSVYAKVGRLVYFGRMLDKIRLHAAGQLPAEYTANLGDAQFYVLDGRCCRFLGVPYAELRERTLAGGTDEEILAWVQTRGTPRTDEESSRSHRLRGSSGMSDPSLDEPPSSTCSAVRTAQKADGHRPTSLRTRSLPTP